jgi:hypothetical protein
VLKVVESSLQPGWSRAVDVEDKWAPALRGVQGCFRWHGDKSGLVFYLTVGYLSKEGEIGVCRVWSSGSSPHAGWTEASMVEWNRVVAAFHDQCLATINPANARQFQAENL